ncbi:hypothetical protein I317_01469 [Kwoniella heveanensis CBS 569]|nr:hypothetical protein I317_01469 [Kwoniella heveanensis CBS 569]
MSFIGAGELEHKVTQLQRQLDHKDHEINSIRNEQRKREEDLAAAKRAKEDAEYKLRDEAERAHKAETSITSKANEIAALQLKLSNLESSLTQTSDKLKIEEREKEKIQDALDAALSGGSSGAAQKMKELQNRNKQLEGALKAAEQEKERLKSQGSSSDPWGSSEPLSRGERNRLMVLQNQVESLKEENERLQVSSPFASSSSLSPVRPASRTKRRSMSVSGPSAASEMIELENQVNSLREQLASKKRDLDKSVNEKLAVEIAAKKKTERLENELDDVKGELEFYRANEGGGGGKEVEKVKKAMQAEKEHMQTQLRAKEEEITQRTTELQKMIKVTERVSELEAQLEQERHARQQLQDSASATAPVARQNDPESLAKIESLEAEVAKLRAQSLSGSSKAADVDLRQIRRELQKAVRDKEYLESLVKENDELLAEKDEQIDRLKTAIPIPGSPTLAPRDDGRFSELEEEIATLQQEKGEQEQEHRQQIEALEIQIEQAVKQLEIQKAAESTIQFELQTVADARAKLNDDLHQASQALSLKAAELERLQTAHAQIQQEAAASLAEVASSKEVVSEAEQRLEAITSALAEKDALLNELSKKSDDLEATLASRSHADVELDQLRQTTGNLEDRLAEVHHSLTSVEAARDELRALLEATEQEKTELLAELQTTENNLGQAQKRIELAETEVRSRAEQSENSTQLLSEQIDDLKAEVSSLQIKYDDKVAELAISVSANDETHTRFEQAVKEMNQLQAKVNELQEAAADRSTESELQEKYEQIFSLEQTKRNLEEDLAEAKKLHQDEIQAAKFKAEQDLLEVRARVTTLEKQITDLKTDLAAAVSRQQTSSTALESTENRKFEHKIAQLRAERDELRHNLSFVQNERHFAVRAALSDKDSALTDLRKIQEELKSKAAVCEKLSSEAEDAKSALEMAKKASEEAVSPEEQARLTERITSLESELAQQSLAVQELRSQLQVREESSKAAEERAKNAEIRAEGFQKELLDMVHHVGQMTKLSDPPARPSSTSPTNEEQSDIPSDLAAMIEAPPAAAPERTKRLSIGHARSRSNASISILPSVVPNFHPERQQLLAKLGRRDARIAELSHDLEKAKLNLTLIQEAQQDTLEDLSELTEERDRLQSELHEASQVGQEVDVDTEILRSLILSLVVNRQSIKSAEARRDLSYNILSTARTTVGVLRASLATATESLSSKEALVTALEQDKASLEARLAETQETQSLIQKDLDSSRQALADVRSRLAAAESFNASSSAEVASSVVALEEQVAEKEERVREFKLQNGELTSRLEVLEKELTESRQSRAEELESLIQKVEELTKEVQAKEQKITDLEAEKEGLAEEINAAERALEDGMADAQAERETTEADSRAKDERIQHLETALQDKQARIAELDAETMTLNKALEEARTQQAERMSKTDAERTVYEQLQKDLVSAQEVSRASETKVTELEVQLEAKQIDLDNARRETADVQRELGEAQTASASHFEQIKALEELKTQLEGAQNNLQAAEESKAALESQIENMQIAADADAEKAKTFDEINVSLNEVRATLDATETEKDGLRRDIEELRAASQNDAEKMKEMEELSVKLEKAESDLRDIESERAVLQKEIEEARAAADADAEKAKELEELSSQLEVARKAKDEVDEVISQLRIEIKRERDAKQHAECIVATYKADLSDLTTKLETLQAELSVAQAKAEAAVQDAGVKQGELETMRAETADLQNQLEKAVRVAQDAATSSASAIAPATAVDESVVSALEERIEQLELSLSRKNEEVDEADDRTRDAFKTNAKLEKKIGKLQRQVESLQVERNTAINKAMSLEAARSAAVAGPAAVGGGPNSGPATTSASAPVLSSSAPSDTPGSAPAPASASAGKSIPAGARAPVPPSANVARATPTSRASLQQQQLPSGPTPNSNPIKQRVVSAPSSTPQRTPLSSVNIFKAPTNFKATKEYDAVPSSGQKRHRETDEVELSKPTVEAIMLPLPPSSAASIGATTAPTSPRRMKTGIIKSSFTPQRSFAPTSASGGRTATTAGMSKGHNVFAGNGDENESARKVGAAGAGADIPRQRLAFPLPPTQNVFGSK